jgi:hypothetical protein
MKQVTHRTMSVIFAFTALLAVIIVVSSGVAQTCQAASNRAKAEPRASVELTASPTKSSTTLKFKTIPAAGLKINSEGPWKLELKSVNGVVPDVKEYNRSEWKEDLAGWEVVTSGAKGSKSIEVVYKMTVFICTADKAICYREVLDQKATVKLL